MTFELPPLPYTTDALAPHVSAETLAEHHGSHHAGHVEKLNELLDDSPLRGRSLEDVIREAEGSLFNSAAQHWNHSFFWHCLSPRGGGRPTGALADALASTWGSFDAFRSEFASTAMHTFGSGWVWLTRSGVGIEIVSTNDAGNPLHGAGRPLLTCDLWEHAYYLDHRSDRAGYLDAFWEIVDWDFVAKNLGEPWAIDKAARRVR